MTGRICCGLEISPAYVDVILRRWLAFTGAECDPSSLRAVIRRALARIQLHQARAMARKPFVVNDAIRYLLTGPKLAKPKPNRRFRTRSAVGRTGYFWMICRSTSARIFPQRGYN